jgi:hypothetical protein
MKTRIVTTAILALFSTALFAQKMAYDAGKTTFGVRAGLNLATITGELANGDNFDYSLRPGLNVGVNAEIPVGTGSYLQPGVLYSQKGATYKNDTGHVKLTYIEVPVNFVYKPTVGTGRMLLGFGPYVGFGLGGKVEDRTGKETDVEFTKNYDANVPDKRQYKGIDAGANLLAGYELSNNVSLQLNAQLGLTQLMPGINGSDNPIKAKNTNFGVSVGYRF